MAGTATLRDDLWTANYNFLQTGAYAISTDNIYSSFNDKLVSDVGLPLVIIAKPIVVRDAEERGMGVDGDELIVGTIKVKIFHSSAEDAKQLTDEVADKYTNGGRTNMSNNWYFKDFDDEEEDAEDEENKKYHTYTLNLIFKKK